MFYIHTKKGITVIICMKNLQLMHKSLLALIFIIQPGITAFVVTQYKRIIHANRLPDIYSNILFAP